MRLLSNIAYTSLFLGSGILSVASADRREAGAVAQDHQLHKLPVQGQSEDAYVPQEPVPFTLTDKLFETLTKVTGFNFTHAYQKTLEEGVFDRSRDAHDGFVRLTDQNYEKLVVQETLPPGMNEEDRVWIAVVHGRTSDPVNNWFMDAIGNASIMARKEYDTAPQLRNIKWARIEYMTEAEVTGRWLVFKPPMYVIITSRGKQLRFLGPGQIRPQAEGLLNFMKEGEWRNWPVWSSSLAPGGQWRWVVETYVSVNKAWGGLLDKYPSWLIVLVITMISQQMFTWFHGSNSGKDQKNNVRSSQAKRTRPNTRSTAETSGVADGKRQ